MGARSRYVNGRQRRRGGTVWLTGLPGSGKTTLSVALEQALIGGGYASYRLDGDEVRRALCSDLGFDRAARAENVRRVAHVARMLADAGVIGLVALISPYAADREAARELHAARGLPFIEVYLDTPVELCEARDPKGLYGQARHGELHGMTGIDDPYEPPQHPDVRLEPAPLETHVEQVLTALARLGLADVATTHTAGTG